MYIISLEKGRLAQFVVQRDPGIAHDPVPRIMDDNITTKTVESAVPLDYHMVMINKAFVDF